MTSSDEPDDEDQNGRDDEDRHSGPLHPGGLNITIPIPLTLLEGIYIVVGEVAAFC